MHLMSPSLTTGIHSKVSEDAHKQLGRCIWEEVVLDVSIFECVKAVCGDDWLSSLYIAEVQGKQMRLCHWLLRVAGRSIMQRELEEARD